MAIQTVFCVTGIETDLSLKRIVVQTNFKIKETTVTPDNVKLYSMDKDNVKLLLPSKMEVSNMNIIITLEKYPTPQDKFYIVVRDLVDELGRELYNMYDKEIYFEDEIVTKVEVISPTDQNVSKTEDIEIAIAISDEFEETKYRFEISSDMAFFNKEDLVFINNHHDVYVSNPDKLKVIGAVKDGNILRLLVKVKDNGQYYLRSRAEKSHTIFGIWSNIVTFNVVTTSPIKDETGFLDDFLLSEEIFKEDFEELKIKSKTPDAVTNQEFYIEFNKDLKITTDLQSKYSQEGLLYIGKGYLIRRDL